MNANFDQLRHIHRIHHYCYSTDILHKIDYLCTLWTSCMTDIVRLLCFYRHVKIWDVMILIPNVLFLFFLLFKIRRVLAKCCKNDSPMFTVCLILVLQQTLIVIFGNSGSLGCNYFPRPAPCGAGAPLFPPCPFTSSFPLFTFPFLSLALPIFFFCPSLPFLPE